MVGINLGAGVVGTRTSAEAETGVDEVVGAVTEVAIVVEGAGEEEEEVGCS